MPVGTTVAVTVPVLLADLTRWDPEETRATDRFGSAVRGAFVVDGGPHTLQVGGPRSGWVGSWSPWLLAMCCGRAP